MPTSTRRQAHARSRNQSVGEPTLDMTSDDALAHDAATDIEPDQVMEEDALDLVEEDDEAPGRPTAVRRPT